MGSLSMFCYRRPNHERPSRLKIDQRTEARVSHNDYTNTGFDRGHMAPNYVIDICYGEATQLQTFLMSNIEEVSFLNPRN